MSAVDWMLLIALVAYVCLMAVAFKYPRTRENWPKEGKETIQIIMSATVFLMLFFLLWYLSATVNWPDAVLVIFWSCTFAFAGLLLVAVFAPQGIRMRWERKKEAKAPDEDD